VTETYQKLFKSLNEPKMWPTLYRRTFPFPAMIQPPICLYSFHLAVSSRRISTTFRI